MKKEESLLKLTTVLFRALHSVERLVQQDIASYPFNTSEFSAMELIYNRGPQPMQVLAERTLLANSSTTYTIDKLVKRKLMTRVPSQEDKRNRVIDLTPKGRSLFKSIFSQHKALLKTLYQEMDEKEINDLIDLLKKVGYRAKALGKKQ